MLGIVQAKIVDFLPGGLAVIAGRGLAILQATPAPGGITLKVTAPGLESASVTLQSLQ